MTDNHSDSDSSFDIESIQEEPVAMDNTGDADRDWTFLDDTTQQPLSGCVVLVEGEPSETRNRAEKNGVPGLVKMDGGIYRAWYVVDNDENIM